MSEDTTAYQNEGASMDSAEFEAKLTDFFTQHKDGKLKLVSRIAEQFKGKEAIVLEHLHNKYVLGIVKEKHKKKATHHDEGASANEAHNDAPAEEAKPKSKKKLIMIIVAALVVALGVVGFLMKDKFMGKAAETAPAAESAPVEATPVVEEPKQEATPVVADSPAAAPDSAGVPADTAKAN